MFELMCELPWRPEKFTKEEWLKDYLFARYGVRDEKLHKHGAFLPTASTTARLAITSKGLTNLFSAAVPD